MSEMDEAHRRDYADLYAIRDLRLRIEAFLVGPPSRAHRTALEHLRNATVDLKADEDHIVRAWD